ncbi:helix-hairpin-helix domain-containing protein [Patescibacteria group bacterium]|nr:helix-hairpin-helix domain-containing protein [Patescibacteria group bacterium]
MKKEKKKENLLERFKFYLLGALALIVLSGSFVLIWQIQKQSPKEEISKNSELENQIADLNKKIDSLNTSLEEAKNASPVIESESYVSSSSSGQVAGDETSSSNVSGAVNLNSASSSQLDSLPGIGPAYAQRIIEYREANGGFKSIEEIENVKGIGPKTFEKLRDLITV